MYDRILLPTDGSDVAAAAAEAAVTFADRFDATLHVVHVLELGELPPGVQDAGAAEFAATGREAIADVEDMASAVDLDVTTAVIEGGDPIYRALLTYVDSHAIDCIVMGTYGRTGLDRLVLGSVTERMLREAPCPVITVHENTTIDGDFDGVLLPTDGSTCASAAAHHATELAVATGAALHIVNVVDPGVVWDEFDSDPVLEALEESGERALRTAIHRADEAGVTTIESAVLRGRPHQAIVDYSATHDIDCIAMGTHGRTGVDRVLLGSVTERVVRMSEVPVIALKAVDDSV